MRRNSSDPLIKTTAVGWATAVVNALIESAVEREAIEEALGYSYDKLVSGYSGRISTSHIRSLWRVGEARVGQCFGLVVASNINPKTFDLLGPSIWYSGTLRDAFTRLAKYGQLIHRSGRTILRQRGDIFELQFLLTSEELSDVPTVAIDGFVGAICNIVRQIHFATTVPISVELQRARPVDSKQFDKFFGVAVAFDAATNSLVFPTSIIDSPLVGGHPAFACEMDRIVEKHLMEVGAIDTEFFVISKIQEAMHKGDLSLKKITGEMGMSARNLQFLLAECGTRYGDLVRELRKEMAPAYLSDSSLSIREVGALLGFVEPSSFTRAFKSWFGVAPAEFRREISHHSGRVKHGADN